MSRSWFNAAAVTVIAAANELPSTVCHFRKLYYNPGKLERKAARSINIANTTRIFTKLEKDQTRPHQNSVRGVDVECSFKPSRQSVVAGCTFIGQIAAIDYSHPDAIQAN